MKVPFPGVAIVGLIEAILLVLVDWSSTNLADQPWVVLVPPAATLIVKLVGLLLNPDPPGTKSVARRVLFA